MHGVIKIRAVPFNSETIPKYYPGAYFEVIKYFGFCLLIKSSPTTGQNFCSKNTPTPLYILPSPHSPLPQTLATNQTLDLRSRSPPKIPSRSCLFFPQNPHLSSHQNFSSSVHATSSFISPPSCACPSLFRCRA